MNEFAYHDDLTAGDVLAILRDPLNGPAVRFKFCKFKEPLFLDGLSLEVVPVFHGCTFFSGLSLDRATLHGHKATASDGNDVEKRKFREQWFKGKGPAEWPNQELRTCIWIDRSVFHGTGLSARETVFSRVVWIANSTFSQVCLTNAQFPEVLRFMNNTVERDFLLSTQWPENPEMRIKRANFRRSRFAQEIGARATFLNRDMRGPIDFRQCHFGNAPEFYGAQISEEFDLKNVRYAGHFEPTSERDYAFLRSLLSPSHGTHSIATLLVQELRAARKKIRWTSGLRWVSLIYDLTSRYGYSVSRPLISSLVAFSIFLVAVCFASLGTVGVEALKTTFGRVASAFFYPPFAANPRYFVGWVCGEDHLLCTDATIVGLVGSVFGVVQILLLWLTGLAIGRRFSLK